MEIFKCETCKGTGVRYLYYKISCKSKTVYKPYVCTICMGSGYIDWIENTRNVDKGFFVEDHFMTHVHERGVHFKRASYMAPIVYDGIKHGPGK